MTRGRSGVFGDLAIGVRLIPARQVAEVAADVNVVPELGCDHAGQRLIHHKATWSDSRDRCLETSLASDFGRVKVASLTNGFFGQKLVHPRRTQVAEEAV